MARRAVGRIPEGILDVTEEVPSRATKENDERREREKRFEEHVWRRAPAVGSCSCPIPWLRPSIGLYEAPNSLLTSAECES